MGMFPGKERQPFEKEGDAPGVLFRSINGTGSGRVFRSLTKIQCRIREKIAGYEI